MLLVLGSLFFWTLLLSLLQHWHQGPACLHWPLLAQREKQDCPSLHWPVRDFSSPDSISPFLRKNLHEQWMYSVLFCVLEGKNSVQCKIFHRMKENNCSALVSSMGCKGVSAFVSLFSCIAVQTMVSHIFSPFFTALWHPFSFCKYAFKAALFLWPQKIYAETCVLKLWVSATCITRCPHRYKQL